jgi:hypothetical protein
MINKSHLSSEGLSQVVGIKASLNKGLSDELKGHFSNTIPVPRPTVEFQGIPDPNWLAGFTSAEGNFFIQIVKALGYKCGAQVKLRFSISQHARDQELIQSLKEYLDCGNYYPHSNRDTGEFVVTEFSDIVEKIIPFFNKHQIEGVKALDFVDFCKVAELMSKQAHLTPEGLEEIRKIKAEKNKRIE